MQEEMHRYVMLYSLYLLPAPAVCTFYQIRDATICISLLMKTTFQYFVLIPP